MDGEAHLASKMTYKSSELGQTDLVFVYAQRFMSRSVHAGLQGYKLTCSSYNL